MHQAYAQINKVLQWHCEPMIICQYRCHSIIHVNVKCFSLRQKFETVHMCAIESADHHEEACSLQPIGFWMKWKCFHEIMTGMGNPFLTTDNKLITLYTRYFPKSMNLTKPSTKYNDTTIIHHHKDTPSDTIKRNSSLMIYNRLDPWKGKVTLGFWNNIVCSSHNASFLLNPAELNYSRTQ